MNLDCNTVRGREWIAKQRQIATRFAATKDFNVVMTNDTTSAAIDAIFFRDFIEAIAEIKARDMTLDALQRFNSYLITFEKLVKGRELAKALCVHFYVITGLSDGHTVYWRICDPAGDWKANFTVSRSLTQATCNDENPVERANAYLSMRHAKCIEPQSEDELW